MIKISVSGGRGKMGDRICRMIRKNKELELSGIIEGAGHPDTGKEFYGLRVVSDASEVMDNTDVFIDFSRPEATMSLLEKCRANKKKIVIGTTGFSIDQLDEIKKASEEIPVLLSPNMSLGVNVMFKIVHEISRQLPGYAKEIIEAHHERKVDSPSGTAEKIIKIISKPEEKVVHGRCGEVGPRQADEIGVHAVRGGNIVGEHTVMWIGANDRLELTHRAQSRDIFAEGAVKAAVWLSSKEGGSLYSMEDVLS